MPQIRIMADSTCDLPADLVAQHNILVVPTYVQFGTESLADDGYELTRPGFYERLARSTVSPTTSAPAVGLTKTAMADALTEVDHIVAITAPERLSSLHNVFQIARRETDPARVTLIDGQQLSMGLGWQVLAAANMAEAGESPAAIQAYLEDMQQRSHVWAALDTLEYLRRSGRVGWAAAKIGGVLQIKPIVHLHQSEVRQARRVRTFNNAFNTLVELAHQAAPLEHLAVMHTRNPQGAAHLEEVLADIRPPGKVIMVEATPVIGVHVGPDGVGLSVVRKG